MMSSIGLEDKRMQLRSQGGDGLIPFIPRKFGETKMRGSLTHNSIEEEKDEKESNQNFSMEERKNFSVGDNNERDKFLSTPKSNGSVVKNEEPQVKMGLI